jgi:HlyD family secretion protein
VAPLEAPPRRRRRWRWLIAALVLVGGLAGLRLTVLATRPLTVDLAPAARGTVEQTVANIRAGSVKARVRAGLSPSIGGRVVVLDHREGAAVDAGEVILRVDSEVAQARVDLAAEDLRAAAARAEETCLTADLAAAELARFVELGERGIASAQTLDTLRTERDRSRAGCAAAHAAVDQARANQRLARAQLALTEVRAPFAGIVAEIRTEVGEWITPSPTGLAMPPVIDLLDPTSLYVTAPIDEMDAARVQVGQEVRLSVDSHRGERFAGHVVRVAPYVLDLVEQNRTVEIEAELDDPARAASLLPGTSADVEVILARRDDVLHIPTAAIAEGDTVLVASGGVLAERKIVPGLANWRTTEVLSGLSEGELVVTSRTSSAVRAGARVAVPEAS